MPRSLLAALAVGLAALPALAADEAAALRARAEQLAAADRCEEALPRATRARELDPRDARAALVEGRCLVRLRRYRESLAPLTAARDLDPKLPGVSADLAQAHYHLDEIDAASAELDRAERENPNDARTQLYRGLVLSRQARQREAALAFDRAGELDPGLTGVAGLYSARSWAAAQDREKAKAALERARAGDPDSEWGRAAARELEAIDEPNRRHVWAKLRAGVEHDSNVTLQNDELPFSAVQVGQFPELRRGDDEQKDTRAVFEAETGLEFLRDEDQSAGGAIGYYGNAHDNVHQLDLQYPWLTFWYDRRLGEDTILRLQPFGGYAWLETDPFVVNGGGTASLAHGFSDRVSARLYTRATVYDFLYRIRPDPVIEFVDHGLSEWERHLRNRDGMESETGVEGRFALAPDSTWLRAGTAYQHYWAEGRDWDRHGNTSWVGVTQALPWRFSLDLLGRFTYHDYEHRSSYDHLFFFPGRYLQGGGPKRRDRIWDAQAELRYPLTSWLQISARGQYTDSESNTEVFDYDRWVAGGYLTVTWSHTL